MIVVTAPTSTIGRQVLGTLLDEDEPVRVVARDPSKLSDEQHDRVEVVPGSHGDPEVVDAVFAGADTVFWLPPPNPRAESVEAVFVDFARPACDAMTKHGVE